MKARMARLCHTATSTNAAHVGGSQERLKDVNAPALPTMGSTTCTPMRRAEAAAAAGALERGRASSIRMHKLEEAAAAAAGIKVKGSRNTTSGPKKSVTGTPEKEKWC